MNKHKWNKRKENSNTVKHLIMGQITTTQNLVAIKEVRHAGQWVDDICRSLRLNELNHWKYLKVCNGQPFMSKDLCRPHAGGTHCSMWVCLFNHCSHCLSHCNLLVKPCKTRSWIENELIELINSDQFRLSIPIQNLSIQFQFNSCWIELNWLSILIQFMNWSEPWIYRSVNSQSWQNISDIV